MEEIETQKKHTGSVIGSTTPLEICTKNSYSFKSAIHHAIEDHKIPIEQSRDTCATCDMVYVSNYHAIAHLLSKCLNYQHQSVFCNPTTNPYCKLCQDHFVKMKEAFDHFFQADNYHDHGDSFQTKAEKEGREDQGSVMELSKPDDIGDTLGGQPDRSSIN